MTGIVTESIREKLKHLADQVCREQGMALFDIDFVYGGKPLVRIIIDGPNGVGVDDCARVSRELSTLLDVEDFIAGSFRLEVSSPGLDRPIRNSADALQMIGRQVHVKTREKIGDRRVFKGRLLAVREECWIISIDGREFDVPANRVEKANLVYEFDNKGAHCRRS